MIRGLQAGCNGYLVHPFEKKDPWTFTTLHFLAVRWFSAIEGAGK